MKAWRGAVALLLAVVAAVPSLLSGVAGAQTDADKARIDREIDATKKQVDTASAEEARLLGLIEESSKRKSVLDAKVAAFDGEIAAVQAQLDAAQSKLSALEAQQRAVEARLDEARLALAEAKAELGRQAIAAYTGQSEAASYATMLLKSSSLGDLASKRSYMRAVVGSQTDAIAATERLRDEVGDLGRQVEASKVEAQGQRDVVAGQRATLQGSRDAQASARAEVQAEIAQHDALRDEVLARKEEFEAELEDLEEESAAIAETLRQRQAAAAAAAAAAARATSTTVAGGQTSGGGGGGGTAAAPAAPSRPPGRLVHPVPGAPVTSPFGSRVHPIYGTVRMHTGIDYGAASGTAIRAAGDGVVVSASWFGGYGNATIVDHGGGLATLYGHQSSMAVSEGQRVTAGQTIGRVGCTGDCTGPHLHFETRVNGDPVNPANYL
ncbi:MAG TPA: peptidoglycan DD-metalloendopeptidase family protein [Acidimicrobiales bacterium]|nr:peptidoglycan DD-metalloendopeptidase family protein [Acidimicrobiales bacterium]